MVSPGTATDGCHPIFSSKKSADDLFCFFLVIALVTTFFAVVSSPLPSSHARRLSSVLSKFSHKNNFRSGVTSLEGVAPGRFAPPLSDATVYFHCHTHRICKSNSRFLSWKLLHLVIQISDDSADHSRHTQHQLNLGLCRLWFETWPVGHTTTAVHKCIIDVCGKASWFPFLPIPVQQFPLTFPFTNYPFPFLWDSRGKMRNGHSYALCVLYHMHSSYIGIAYRSFHCTEHWYEYDTQEPTPSEMSTEMTSINGKRSSRGSINDNVDDTMLTSTRLSSANNHKTTVSVNT